MSERKNRITTWLKRLLVVSLILIGFVIIFFGTIILIYSTTDMIEKTVVDYLNIRLRDQVEIRFASLRGSLLNHIEIEKLEIVFHDQARLDGTGQARLSADYVELDYNLLQLLYNRVQVNKIFIDRLDVEVFPPVGEQPGRAQEAEPFSLDSTLNTIQNLAFIDSLLESLPEIGIRDVQVFAGSVHLVNQEMTFSQIDAKIERLQIDGTQFFFKLDQLKGYWPEKDLRLRNVSFVLSGDGDHITLNQLQVHTEKSKLSCSAYYGYKRGIDLTLDVHECFIDMNEIYQVSGDEEFKDGFIQGSLSVSGKPLHFIMQADLNGRWQDHRIHQINVNGEYNHGLVTLKDVALHSDAGLVRASGQGRENQGARGKLQFETINLNRLAADLMPTDLNGALTIDFKSLNFKRPTGKGFLSVYHSHIDSVRFDSLRLALDVQAGNWQILKPSFLRFAQNSRFELEGTLTREQEMDLSISSFNNDLSDLSRAFRIDDLQGLFDMQIRGFGALADPTISGSVTFPFVEMDSVRLQTIDLRLYVQNIFTERNGNLDFLIDSAWVYAVPLSDITLQATSLRNELDIETLQFQNKQNYLAASARAVFHPDSIELVLPFFKAEYENYWLANDGDMVFFYDSSGFRIKALKLQGPQDSHLNLNGFWDRQNNDLSASLLIDRMEIEPFEQFWLKQFKLQGTVAGSIDFKHLLTNPDIDLNLNAQQLIYNDAELGDLRSQIQFQDSSLFISQLTLQKDERVFDIGGNFGFNFGEKGFESFDLAEGTLADFRINWENIDLAALAPVFKTTKRLRGQLSGYMEVGGNVIRPRLRQFLSIDNFMYGDYEIDSLRMFGQYNSGYIILDSLSGVFNKTRFDLRGWQRYNLNLADIDTNILNQPWNLYLRSSDDGINFLGLFNEQLESIEGVYDLELYIGGTPLKPAITQGHIKMDNGSLLLARVMDPIERLKMDITIADSVMTIHEFSGYSIEEKDFWQRGWRLIKALVPWSGRKINEGYVSAKGSIALHDATRPRLDLTVNMDELYINYFVENTKLLLTTRRLSISGRDTISVAGSFYIPKAEYEVDFAKIERNLYLYETTTEPLTPPYLAVNLNVFIPGGFTITSSPLDLTNNFRVGINGNLQIIIEPADVITQISGHLEITSGKYSSWNQNFEVRSGSIDFINPKVLNPDINLVAAKQLGPRLFELIISGNLEKLSQQIRVSEGGREIDLPMMDKIAMLTFGTDLQQVTTRTDSTLRNVGSEIVTTSLLTAVERGAEQLTGLDKVEITASDNILDLNRVRLNNGLKDASISLGKYLTTDLYIEYRTQFNEGVPAPRLSWDAGNRLGLEYRINRHWSFDSFYEKTMQGNNKIQLGLNWQYQF